MTQPELSRDITVTRRVQNSQSYMTSWDTLPLSVLGCISQDCQLHDILGYPAIKCARVYIPGLSELHDILGYPAKCARVYIP